MVATARLGRGIAAAGARMSIGVLALLCILLNSVVTEAKSYKVGGDNGWGNHVVNWTDGKKFKAGDVLQFNYDQKIHNVVKVNKQGYSTCTCPKSATIFQTGSDKIKLTKGMNYFICSLVKPANCDSSDMRIRVFAD